MQASNAFEGGGFVMFSAITTLLNKTIDVFLQINSGEGRRRIFAKDIFNTYKALDEIAQALRNITVTVEDITGITKDLDRSVFDRQGPDFVITRGHSSGYLEIQTYQLAENGTEQITPAKRVKYRDILPSVLSSDIRRLNKAISKLANIMSAESWDLRGLHHQPDKLRALGIYDDAIVSTFNRAWFADGGFVEALFRLGLDQEIDGKVLMLRDAEFDPRTSPYGYKVKGDETRFSLDNTTDVAAFIDLTTKCQNDVIRSRDKVKTYIAANCSIEDIL
ncbi:hypothetical protein HRE53_26865 (plasmid) [Acaryochloris sp. 'Moss Beach']|uniref:hypothetical protein n=1 Tax=Acaryochloris sp. 'Moss Beach' TaxID=2740837 RepID=UPI001F1ABEAF|nr:hypothetical protein [Acaryochloris sp. 'Moss Beach']UJB72242.1 hypothetical protein HRE53_26865 [Acaryochloris sp. 'Moss Beach']